jgi:AraC-like DNA-binding protein
MDLYEIQVSNPDLFQQFSLKDTLFLHYSCPQREKVLQLCSKYIQFNFTLSGKRILKQGNRKWEATPENGLVVKKCALMQELPDDYEGWDVLIFYMRDNYLRALFEEFRPYLSLKDLPEPNKFMFEPFAIGEHIRNSYQSFIPYILENKTLPDDVFENKFKELLFNILSHPKNKHILAWLQKITDRYEAAIREVMESNYMYHLKIRDYANIANCSVSTFKREFKKHYDISPGRWLTERRLLRAEVMLRSGDRSISEIAFDCGFKNPSHFSRIFKDKYGMAPSKFEKT